MFFKDEQEKFAAFFELREVEFVTFFEVHAAKSEVQLRFQGVVYGKVGTQSERM